MASHNTPTKEEQQLAKELQRAGIRLYTDRKFWYLKQGKRQYIKPDISIPDLKLCIEVDGRHHKGQTRQSTADRLRTRTIHKAGWEVQRVSNDLVNNPKELRAFINEVKLEWHHRGPPYDYSGIQGGSNTFVREKTPAGPISRNNRCKRCNKEIPIRYIYCEQCSEIRKKQPSIPKKAKPPQKKHPQKTSVVGPVITIIIGIIFLRFISITIGLLIIIPGVIWLLIRNKKKK